MMWWILALDIQPKFMELLILNVNRWLDILGLGELGPLAFELLKTVSEQGAAASQAVFTAIHFSKDDIRALYTDQHVRRLRVPFIKLVLCIIIKLSDEVLKAVLEERGKMPNYVLSFFRYDQCWNSCCFFKHVLIIDCLIQCYIFCCLRTVRHHSVLHVAFVCGSIWVT